MMVLQKAVVDTISEWGVTEKCTSELDHRLEAIEKSEGGGGDLTTPRRRRMDDFWESVGYCQRVETTSLVELALWNMKMTSVVQKEEPEINNGQYRESCRCRSGAGVAIENVFGYLWDGESRTNTAISIFPLVSTLTVAYDDDN
mmetsp:Transcript_31414/g.75749  ORF Transcript_31414/g.75749 Transcript_31414/m.75749 type:complete len:144 (+) Transcript_31414:1092-1523(+)